MSGAVLTVLRTELRSLVRDRRAFFAAVVLPMALYPVMFWGMDRLERRSEESLDERTVRVAPCPVLTLHAPDPHKEATAPAA